jgi:hypothetical protein
VSALRRLETRSLPFKPPLEFRAGHRVMCSLNSRQAGRTAELPQSHAISKHEARGVFDRVDALGALTPTRPHRWGRDYKLECRYSPPP